MVLLYLASLWREQGGPPLTAIHIHHGLEDSADDWAALCQQACDRLDIDLQIRSVTVARDAGKGLEAAARTARYAVFRQVLGPGELLMLAHHGDDQAETILHRLFRGTGPRGLAGMPRRRALGHGLLSRPLLGVSRSDIESWAEGWSLPFVTDPSNADVRFDRGYLRQHILPAAQHRWPQFANALGRCAEQQERLLARLGEQALPVGENLLGEPVLAMGAVSDRALLTDLIHHWLSEAGLQAPPATRLTEFARQCLEAGADRSPELPLTDGVLRSWRGHIALTQIPDDLPELPRSATVGAAQSGAWGRLEWTGVADSVGLPPGQQLSMRYRREGEKLVGPDGQSRDFGKLCQEYDVPPWWRSRLPLLTDGDTPVYAPLIGPLAGFNQGVRGQSGGLTPLWNPTDFEPLN